MILCSTIKIYLQDRESAYWNEQILLQKNALLNHYIQKRKFYPKALIQSNVIIFLASNTVLSLYIWDLSLFIEFYLIIIKNESSIPRHQISNTNQHYAFLQPTERHFQS